MLQEEHSAILSTFSKLPFSFKTFVLSIFKWPLKTGFIVRLLLLVAWRKCRFVGFLVYWLLNIYVYRENELIIWC